MRKFLTKVARAAFRRDPATSPIAAGLAMGGLIIAIGVLTSVALIGVAVAQTVAGNFWGVPVAAVFVVGAFVVVWQARRKSPQPCACGCAPAHCDGVKGKVAEGSAEHAKLPADHDALTPQTSAT